MHARVVEFDTLADTVRPRSKDEDRRLGAWHHLGLVVVARVVVRRARRELGGAGVDGLVDGSQVEVMADTTNGGLGAASDASDLRVGEAVAFGELKCRKLE